jgi:PmbA protein
MMQDLLKKALKKSDQAEIYYTDSSHTNIEFNNGKLHDIQSSIQSGYSIRIIKNRLLGFSYTKNLLDPEGLIENGVRSLEGKVEAEFDFPVTPELPKLKTYDPAIKNLNSEKLIEECNRISKKFLAKTSAEVEISASVNCNSIKLVNSAGTDLNQHNSAFVVWANLCYPGGAAGLSDFKVNFSFAEFPDNKIDTLIESYNLSQKPVKPAGGKMQVLFMPNSIYTLMWRLKSATNGKLIYEKTSPLIDKIGEKVFSDKLTIYDDPLNDNLPGARSFDDEGEKTDRTDIVNKGVLKNFYYDLNYAAKMNTRSTGNGYKAAQWGGEIIKLKPLPVAAHLFIKPGETSLQEMINSIDRGIILHGVMGAHSGNIPNGDYSVGVSPGIYVEKGKIVGRVKDAMVAGNIYETLNCIETLENRLHPSFGGTFPAILCDKVSVSIK